MWRDSGEPADSFYEVRPECGDLPKTRFKIKAGKTLSARRWRAAFSPEGYLDIASTLSRIQRGGVHPTIRGEVWEFLLGCFDPKSTYDERDQLRQRRRLQYARWKEDCQKMDSHVGSGKIITAPIISEDGEPIKDPLVLLESTPDRSLPSPECKDIFTSEDSRINEGENFKEEPKAHVILDKKIIQWKLTLHQIGIYMGGKEKDVIQFGPPAGEKIKSGNISASSANPDYCTTCVERAARTEGVNETCLECFGARSGKQVHGYLYGVTGLRSLLPGVRGTKLEADPAEKTLHRASYLLEHGFRPYHLRRNNCEDFAIYCKTGHITLSRFVGLSSQVRDATLALSGAGILGFVAMFLTMVIRVGWPLPFALALLLRFGAVICKLRPVPSSEKVEVEKLLDEIAASEMLLQETQCLPHIARRLLETPKSLVKIARLLDPTASSAFTKQLAKKSKEYSALNLEIIFRCAEVIFGTMRTQPISW